MMQESYAAGNISYSEVKQVLSSYHAHFAHCHGYRLERRSLAGFHLERADNTESSDIY